MNVEEPKAADVKSDSQEGLARPAEVPCDSVAAPETKRELAADLRTPWTGADLAIFVLFSLVSLVALDNFLVRVARVWLAIKPGELVRFVTTNAPFIALRQALWFGVLMLYLFAIIRIRFGTPFWHTIGWRQLGTHAISRSAAYVLYVSGGSMLALVMQFASAFIGTKAKLPIEAFFRDRGSVLLMMAMGILVAPVVEETIFRGYIYPVLARSLGIAGGVLGTGALFGLMHAPQLWGGWGQIGLLVFVGVVFTYVRARTGTVVATYFLHLGYNSLLFLGFYLSTGGLRHLPVSS
jgi:membrane protease YdiL (CAAX protease family)